MKLSSSPPTRDLVTGIGFIALGIYFNLPYVALGVQFDSPNILRQPADEVLTRFTAGGTPLIQIWYAFTLAALAMIPLALWARSRLSTTSRSGVWIDLATVAGVIAGLTQAIGLSRWVFAVPYLAMHYNHPAATDAAQAAIIVTFETLHRFVGVALGEHLGQLATAVWAGTFAWAWFRLGRGGRFTLALGLASAATILAGLAEGFVTVIHFDPGWLGFGTMIGYLLLSLWMIVVGVQFCRPAKCNKPSVGLSPPSPAADTPEGSIPSSA